MEFESLAVGWLLGVLGIPLTMYLQGVVDKRRFKTALESELKEVKYRLAVTVYNLRDHLRIWNRDVLDRTISEIRQYPENQSRNNILQLLQTLNELSDDQLAAITQRPRDPLGAKSVPNVHLPYLSSQSNFIGLLKVDEQKSLVNLLHYVEVIRVKRQEMNDWITYTFNSSSDQNHQSASQNADSNLEAIVYAAERSIDSINDYLG